MRGSRVLILLLVLVCVIIVNGVLTASNKENSYKRVVIEVSQLNSSGRGILSANGMEERKGEAANLIEKGRIKIISGNFIFAKLRIYSCFINVSAPFDCKIHRTFKLV